MAGKKDRSTLLRRFPEVGIAIDGGGIVYEQVGNSDSLQDAVGPSSNPGAVGHVEHDEVTWWTAFSPHSLNSSDATSAADDGISQLGKVKRQGLTQASGDSCDYNRFQ